MSTASGSKGNCGNLFRLRVNEKSAMASVSDEEIESDGVADGYSDDDFGLGSDGDGEGFMITDLLNQKAKKHKPAQSSRPQVSKGEVTARAKILRGAANKVKDADDSALEPLLVSDSEPSDDDGDEDALHSVVKAATGRDLRARQARANAVNVTQGVGNEDVHAAPIALERSGREVMDKMLDALQGDADGEGNSEGARNLSSLKKRVERAEKGGRVALDAPLPDVVTGRIERAAAYRKTTRTLTQRWAGVVKDNRRAKQLNFPLNTPSRAVHRSTADAVGSFVPTGTFEEEIDALLKEGGVVAERDVEQAEDDALQGTVSKDEVIARRRELARMRSLLFDNERKMKRISKIKSKRFRKIMKNEKMRVSEELADSDGEDAVAARMKAESRRAEERMTLRHKNTSKWVKRQLSRGETKRNTDARAAIEEQLRLHEELKRRQEGVMELSGSDKDDSDRELDDIGSDVEDLDDELRKMKDSLVADEGKKHPKFKSGLMNMNFMQAAAERERKEALELLNEMGSDEEGLDEYGSDTEGKEKDGKKSKASRPMARRKFSGSAELDAKKVLTSLAESEEPEYAGNDEGDAEEEEEERLTKEAYEVDAALLGEGEDPVKPAMSSVEDIIREGNDAPAGFVTTLAGRISAKTNTAEDPVKIRPVNDCAVDVAVTEGGEADNEDAEVSGGADSDDKQDAPADKKGGGQKRKRAKGQTENASQLAATGAKSKQSKADKRVKFSNVVSSMNGEDEVISAKHNELSQPEIVPSNSNKKPPKSSEKSKSQNDNQKEKAKTLAEARKKVLEADRARMEMVARAFAGLGGADEADFEASKNATIENEIDKETKAQATTALPGWGAWDGAGLQKKRKKSAFAEAAEKKLAEARSRAIGKRADKNHRVLQLSTKRSKSARALTIAAVPFPYRSKEEWEREISVPVVQELVARKSFQNSIAEKVQTRRGIAIQPIKGGAVMGSGRGDKGKWKGRKNSKTSDADGAKGIQKPSKGRPGVLERRQRTAKAREGKRRALLS